MVNASERGDASCRYAMWNQAKFGLLFRRVLRTQNLNHHYCWTWKGTPVLVIKLVVHSLRNTCEMDPTNKYLISGMVEACTTSYNIVNSHMHS